MDHESNSKNQISTIQTLNNKEYNKNIKMKS